MKKNLAIALLLINFFGFSQSDQFKTPEIIPPSPTVANLMNFEEVPVDHYSGQADISIPIYVKDLGFGVQLPVALRYNTQGIKIDSRSGWTGTSWSLEAGGVISRTVRGIADEEAAGGLNGSDIGVFHNDDFWNYDDLEPIYKEEFRWKAGKGVHQRYDHQSDVFQFSALGLSGRFIIVKEGSNLTPKLLTKNQQIRISIDYHPDTYTLHSFTLTDTSGNTYLFEEKEIMQSESLTATRYFNNSENLLGEGNIKVTTNAWHLTKITSPNGINLATFFYTDIREQYLTNVSRTRRTIVNPPSNWNDMMRNSYNPTAIFPRKEHTYNTTFGRTKKLTKITFRDQSSIDFEILSGISHPETSEISVDATGAILEEIIVKDENGTVHKTVHLDYDITDRLWLTSVTETIGNSNLSNVYNLEYNNKEDLLPFDSVSDDWGYTSGWMTPTGNACGATATFDKDAILTGLLKQITYPTGGAKEFVFENNRISYHKVERILDPSVPEGGAISLTDWEFKEGNPENWDIQTIDFTVNNTINNYPNTETPIEFETTSTDFGLSNTFTIPNNQRISLRVSNPIVTGTLGEEETPEDVLFNAQVRLVRIDGTETFEYPIRLDDSCNGFNIPAGTYEIRFISLHAPSITTIQADIQIKYKDYITDIKRYIYGGGVRIKSVLFKEIPTTDDPSTKVTYLYDENDGIRSDSGVRSSGAIDGTMDGLRKNYTQRQEKFLFGQEDICHNFNQHIIYYAVETDGINSEFTKGGYVGYKKVKVVREDVEEGTLGSNGYTNYTYTSPQDYASPPEVFTYPYAPAPNLDFKRGLLLSSEVYDDKARKLTSSTHTYEFEETLPISTNYNLYETPCAWTQFYGYYSSYEDHAPDYPVNLCAGPGGCNADCISFYNDCGTVPYYFKLNPLISGWAKLKETVVTEYFYEGDETTTSNETSLRDVNSYDTTNFQVNQKDTYFKEEGIEQHHQTKYFYPTAPSFYGSRVAELLSLNKVNEVLAIEQYKNGEKISTIVNTYDEFSPNLVLLKKVSASKGEIEETGGLVDALGNLEERLVYHSYNFLGLPMEVSQKDGTRISYVWGYDTRYPIAKLENASYSDMSSAQIATIIAAMTASNADNDTAMGSLGSEGVLRDALQVLREAFPEAMVTTLTYDPLIGMTSSTDARRYTTYYSYNSEYKLQWLKDNDQQMLMSYSYHYKTQSGGDSNATNTENYVKTNTYQNKPQYGSLLISESIIENITYFDGLGRAKQTIAPKAGGQGQDIIMPIVYDGLGRQTKEYLPFADVTQSITSSSIAIRNQNSLLTDIDSYYSTKYPEDINNTNVNAFSEVLFEASPLQRILKQGAPGEDWLIDTASDADHSIKMEYQSNIFSDTDNTKDNVRLFDVTHPSDDTQNIQFNDIGFYATGELYKIITKDENWISGYNHTTEEFKNKLGQMVLKRTYNYGERHDTYYVYDDFGNLTYVIPPKASAATSGITSTILDELCYQYKYDSRNRLIEKKIPGKDWEYIVYDILDRPVLTQDANLRTTSGGNQYKWLFTKYDAFGRMAYTGIYESNGTRQSIQEAFTSGIENDTYPLFEERVTTANTIDATEIYYSNLAFPTTEFRELHTINYYDNYAWDVGTSMETSSDLNTSTNLTIDGTAIIKNGNGWNGGFTTNTYLTGDGYIQFTATATDKRVMIGLSSEATASNHHYNTIEYAIYIYNNGRVYIYNNGTFISSPLTPYNHGDTFKVERDGDTILFKQNDVTFYAMPATSGVLIGDASFYDDGTKVENVFLGFSAMGEAFTNNAKGLPTGGKIRTLDTNDWTTSVNYYDEKARIVHAISENEYLQTKDVLSSKLDFTGKVLQTRATHTKGENSPIITEDLFTYDHMGRLLYQTQEINGLGKELIAKQHYDELGQLVQKQVGGRLPKENDFQHLVGVAASGSYIEKTAPDGPWDAGLTTVDAIAGDGYIEASPLQTNKAIMFGLNDTNDEATTVGAMEYAIYFTSGGKIRIYESGSTDGLDKETYVPGDMFSIERRGKRVVYLKNGQVFYTSAPLSIIVPLYGDVTMYHQGGKLNMVLVDLEKELQEVDFTYNIRGWLTGINDVTTPSNDLFSFKLQYNKHADPLKQLFNGNISSTSWKTQNIDNNLKTYNYSYDHLNRITEAIDNTGNYNLDFVSYDKNGNITNLKRSGHLNEEATSFGDMDDLVYTYDIGNKLTKVKDLKNPIYGFKDDVGEGVSDTVDDYSYDANGNMISDQNKDITNIDCNYLNLPTQITFGSGVLINYKYDATGIKLEKKVKQGKTLSYTQYANNFVYKGNILENLDIQFIQQPEGYIEPLITSDRHGITTVIDTDYVYQYKDHLGNIRLAYQDANDDGVITNDEIKEEKHYYPFGMTMRGFNNAVSGTSHPYGYNGKEENFELGLDWVDYGARNYEVSLGRWMNIDPLANDPENYEFSTYNYTINNPILFIDPNGMIWERSIDKYGNITYTAGDGDSAWTLFQQFGEQDGFTADMANQMIQDIFGANRVVDGEEFSNINPKDTFTIYSNQEEESNIDNDDSNKSNESKVMTHAVKLELKMMNMDPILRAIYYVTLYGEEKRYAEYQDYRDRDPEAALNWKKVEGAMKTAMDGVWSGPTSNSRSRKSISKSPSRVGKLSKFKHSETTMSSGAGKVKTNNSKGKGTSLRPGHTRTGKTVTISGQNRDVISGPENGKYYINSNGTRVSLNRDSSKRW